jgi:hypothetical protein
MKSFEIEEFVNVVIGVEKVNNPTINNFYKNYISKPIDFDDGFIDFLKQTYRCPFADNWGIVFKQCFDYWMESDCNVWNDEILYDIMCIVTKEGHPSELPPT